MTETVDETRERRPGTTASEEGAPTSLPVEDEIRNRWSPRAFADRDVSDRDLRTLFEAARWAPSSYNEQPWRFIVARRRDPEDFDRMVGCLAEANRRWAPAAPVLMLTVASRYLERDGRENRHAWHDVGLAMGNLSHQATSMGLSVHQMAGILPDRAREAYDIPDDFTVVTGVAIGYRGDPEELDDPVLREKEERQRTRRPLSETVFTGTWRQPADFVDEPGRSAP